jgi:hypothetical protein
MKIANLEESISARATHGHPKRRDAVDGGERFKRCQRCGGYFDILGLAWVLDHEGELPHPSSDRPQ